ncbi:MAG: hypothetical protein ABSH47_17530 [Bryobacteraceae bacterium]|jgi:hypothetical protein
MKIGNLASLAVAAFCLTFGTPAKACNVPRPGLGPLLIPDLASIVAQQAVNGQIGVAEAGNDSAAEPAGSEALRENTDGPGSIVGLWQITFVSGGQVVDVGFDAWHSDGTEMLNDTPPPATGNVCLGVWTQSGRMTYKLKHPSWTFDNAGNLTGTAVIRETVTLGTTRNNFAGTFTIDFYDNSGNSTGNFTGQVQATRITPN